LLKFDANGTHFQAFQLESAGIGFEGFKRISEGAETIQATSSAGNLAAVITWQIAFTLALEIPLRGFRFFDSAGFGE